MQYKIELLKTASGTRFNFQQDDAEKIITWAGSLEPMTINHDQLAKILQQSLIDNPCWFDETGNLMIPSPLYFLLSVQHGGPEQLLDQIENRSMIWSQEAFFQRNENERIAAAQNGVATPVNDYLKTQGLKPVILPVHDFEDWENLSEEHFLPEYYIDKLNEIFDSLPEKEQIVMLYFAFNSPFFVSVLAWLRGFFPNDEAFAHYTLVMEGVVTPVNMAPEDFEKEIQLRVNMFADIHHFLKLA